MILAAPAARARCAAAAEPGATLRAMNTMSRGALAMKWLDEHSDPDDETIKHYLSLCRRATCREVLAAVKSAARKRIASASGTAGAFMKGPRS